MARPSTGANLSLAALQHIMESRKTELNRLRKQRTKIQRELDAVDREIGKIEGSGNGRGGGAGAPATPRASTTRSRTCSGPTASR